MTDYIDTIGHNNGYKYKVPAEDFEDLASWSEIMPNFIMGRRPDSYIGYDLVVSCEWHLAKKPTEGYEGVLVHLPMRDEDSFILNKQAIHSVAELISINLKADQRVLVHCTGGLNRSGVVAAKAIQKYYGYDEDNNYNLTGKEAVLLLRLRRDKWVLCNRVFERWVTGEKLPTAETSMFNIKS